MAEPSPPSEAPHRSPAFIDTRPSRRVFLLAYLAVVVAGIFGALIGAGLVGVSCRGRCDVPRAIGAFGGGALGAVGVGIVAVLVLRAMTEWRLQGTPLPELTPEDGGEPSPGEDT